MNTKKLTIRGLLDLKGKRQLLIVNAKDVYLAKACEQAGIDNIVAGTDSRTVRLVSNAAPNTLITGALSYDRARISDACAVENAMQLLEAGADVIYTMGISSDRVRVLSRENVPCVGHVGLVPYLSTWYGGMRAIGKTAEEAQKVLEDTLRLEDAGAIGVEMECVPARVAAEITARTGLLTISMGSGEKCDAQYLFACDLLGSHDGHYPRHCVKYGDFFNESVRIFRRFREDVERGIYPQAEHAIGIEDREFNAFLEKIQ